MNKIINQDTEWDGRELHSGDTVRFIQVYLLLKSLFIFNC